MTWLLGLLFPLWALMPKARALGSVMFATVEGVGWQCTIRPPTADRWKRGAINSWSGQGSSLGRALRDAIAKATAHPSEAFEGATYAPKLGGDEFDDE